MSGSIQHRTVVQCPSCGFKVTERMPAKLKVKVFHCPGCNEYAHVSDTQCCIFCAYARNKCPEQQLQDAKAQLPATVS